MANLIHEWNILAVNAIRKIKPGPPMAARSLGIVFTAMYDAWAAYDDIAKPVHSTVPRRPPAQRNDNNRRTAISMAAYRALKDQFPADEASFAAKLVAMGLNPADTSTSVNSPVGVGNVAAAVVINFRHADGANQLGNMPGSSGQPYSDYTHYQPVNPPMAAVLPAAIDAIPHPDRWQPLTYQSDDYQLKTPAFIGPHWGNVKPFALTTGSQFRPAPPQSLTSQGFLDQAKHIIEIQANLTVEQKVIAEYWADGPTSELPPGHWMEFAAFVAERDALDMSSTLKLCFAVANAILDASIATWEAKRYYDYVRPITAIRHLFRGKTIRGWGGPGLGIVDMPGEYWKPFQQPTFPTPPFSEFTSGHSAFSMAAAVVLKQYTDSDKFGYHYAQTEPLRADPLEPVTNVVLHWDTFTQAAQEAGESRLYGGIHFYEGNVAGLELGRKVGEAVFNKAVDYWNG